MVLCYYLLKPVYLITKYICIRDDIGMLLTCVDVLVNVSRRFVKKLITTDMYIITSQNMQKKRSRHFNLVQTCSLITIMKRASWLHRLVRMSIYLKLRFRHSHDKFYCCLVWKHLTRHIFLELSSYNTITHNIALYSSHVCIYICMPVCIHKINAYIKWWKVIYFNREHPGWSSISSNNELKWLA